MRRLVLLATPIALFAGLAVGGSQAAAAGITLYVSTSGADTNPCTQSKPCATLQHAVDQAAVGGTVKVLPGTYNQTVNITKPVSLIGSGENSTIIDGSNIDTGAGAGTQDPSALSSTPYYGVVSVQNNTGTGGAIKISGLGIDHAFVTAQESTNSDVPSDLSVYNDANPNDKIAITEVTLGAVQDPADYGGIGLDVFDDKANVSFLDGISTGNFQGAQLEGGGTGGHVTVTKSVFTHLVACQGACAGGGSSYPAEGLSIISDQPGTAVATINSNTFQNYAGFGIAVDAGYAAGNCTSTVCTGNVNLIAKFNHFRMGACAAASDDCSAIFLDARAGNKLTALLQGNSGTIRKPGHGIFEQPPTGTGPGDGIYSVTEINNHITVTN